MNFLRKLELSGGVLTAAIGLFVALSYIRLDQQASERLGLEFPINSVIIFSLLYLLPGLLILFGSYIHSLKRKQVGQFILIVGSMVNVVNVSSVSFQPLSSAVRKT